MKLSAFFLSVTLLILPCNNPWDPRTSLDDEQDLENKEYNDSCDLCPFKDKEESEESKES